MEYRRSTLETYLDLLSFCIQPKRISEITRLVNIPHERTRIIISFLTKKELIIEIPTKSYMNSKSIFQTTQKGNELITKYKDFINFFNEEKKTFQELPKMGELNLP